MKTHSVLLTCILITFLIGTANAGIMITGQDEGDMPEAIIYQDGVMIALDGNKKAGMIIDTQKNQCTWFNHSSRKFVRGCQSFSDSMSGIKAKGDVYMQSIMSRLTPEQQAMMKKQMENEKQNLPEFKIKKIGHTNFQGFSVNKYHFLIQGSPVAEVWLSPDLLKAMSREIDKETIEKVFGGTDDKDGSDFGRDGRQEVMEKKINDFAEKENAFVIKRM
ncbi:hypothetical protein MNBD_GAMMA04-1506, partial [hydrothermal vent metagenome]